MLAFAAGFVTAFALVVAAAFFALRRVVPRAPTARGASGPLTPVRNRETAIAVLNGDHPARRRAVAHSPLKES